MVKMVAYLQIKSRETVSLSDIPQRGETSNKLKHKRTQP